MKKMIIIWVAVAAMVSDYVYAHSSHVQTQQENVQAVATVEKVSVNEEIATIKEVIESQNMEISRLEEELANLTYESAELKNQENSETKAENILGLSTADQVIIIMITVLMLGMVVYAFMNPPVRKHFDSGHPWNWL